MGGDHAWLAAGSPAQAILPDTVRRGSSASSSRLADGRRQDHRRGETKKYARRASSCCRLADGVRQTTVEAVCARLAP